MSVLKTFLISIASDGQSKCHTPCLMQFEEYALEAESVTFVCTARLCKRRRNCTVTISIMTRSTIDDLTLSILSQVCTFFLTKRENFKGIPSEKKKSAALHRKCIYNSG